MQARRSLLSTTWRRSELDLIGIGGGNYPTDTFISWVMILYHRQAAEAKLVGS